MTIKERLFGILRPELMAAYRMRDQAELRHDIALRKAAEAEKAVRHERIYADFWRDECGRADRQLIEIERAVKDAGDLDALKEAIRKILYRNEGGRAVYKAAGKEPAVITVDDRRDAPD